MSAENPELNPYVKEFNGVREMLEYKQAHLDTTLEGLSEEIESWNEKLTLAKAYGDMSRNEIWKKLATEAVNSLDKQWPFMNDYLHVSGIWYVPQLSLSSDGIEYPMYQSQAFNTVRSNGFQVFQEDYEPPRVGLSFAVSELPVANAALQGRLDLLTYADPKDINLIYARPNQTQGTLSDPDKIHNGLLYYDNLLYLHYHSDNSKFFDKPVEQQKKFLTQVIDTVSDLLPSPEFGDNAVCEEVIVPYVYQYQGSTGAKHIWKKFSGVDNEHIILSGRIDGISILEAPIVTGGKPLRSKNELVDSDASICLVLNVDQCSMEYKFDGQPVYVPLRLVESIVIAT